MNRTRTFIALAASAGIVSAGLAATAAYAESTPSPTATSVSVGSLSADVQADLAFAREEERMARDLYDYFADTYDQARPFSTIVRSETQHFDTIGGLLIRYDVADPAAGLPAGTYTNAAIQELYDDWKAQGDLSLAEAYKVGVELENRDIADLEDMSSGALPSDVAAAYANLLRGSENHLSAFTAATEGTVLGAGAGSQYGTANGRGTSNGLAGGNRQQATGQAVGDASGTGYARTGEPSADCPLVQAP